MSEDEGEKVIQFVDEDLIGVREAAKILNVGGRRVLHFLQRDMIPARKIANAWVMRRADVDAFKQKVRPAHRPRIKGVRPPRYKTRAIIDARFLEDHRLDHEKEGA